MIALFPFVGIGQIQIGADIDGLTSNAISGESVALSADGSIVAIGAQGSLNGTGMVRVFQNIDGIRTQIGDNIIGESATENSGTSLSLSADGSVIAIGAPNNDDNGENSGLVRIFKNIASVWVQVGQDINGEELYDACGRSVSLSADGNIVAIGSNLNDENDTNSGQVRVFQNVEGSWVQLGMGINGTGYNHQNGYSVALSAEGNTVAIGSPFADTNLILHGYVKIYQYIQGDWIKIGGDIQGYRGAQCGRSVALSADGTIVACGAPFFIGEDAKHVRVYQLIAGSWQQIGSSINGPEPDIGSGSSVCLSADGNLIAIGNVYGSVNGSNSGQVQIYKNVSGAWTQLGSDINGEAMYDQSGIGLSLSGDGTTLAIGARFNGGNGYHAGHVRIFDLSGLLAINQFKEPVFSVYPNPVSTILNIETTLTGNYQTKVINQLGQLILVQNHNSATNFLDVSRMSKGIYFVYLSTDEGHFQTIKFLKY